MAHYNREMVFRYLHAAHITSLDAGVHYLGEFGDPWRNETDFRNLLSYSPLQNIRVPNGTHQYPATLITVGKRQKCRAG